MTMLCRSCVIFCILHPGSRILDKFQLSIRIREDHIRASIILAGQRLRSVCLLPLSFSAGQRSGVNILEHLSAMEQV